ncbi:MULTISPECIES: hypothetical protein [unclassified Polaromonas]|jgi:hypothetical protein|uniref:hypothetical protein n=1 Tax=unclassified Polaromonas TaxID=2638319 RepID=UPI000BD2FDD7|nr:MULTISPECIES: hypothetical protein [unclassified Polaromonas]OYY35864.1 MAG: hypothetical protein B7Y60_11965 [Polaromonas sp. 35-63-35]OYZ19830.1 MAG: hypothetical protein B7Y28_11175 [Polaromonas sp. 16-63-31]OYZ79903.1 MAG: hypothetical protein B7Y09_05990 [Polaromonas sp. 24-63-21]OZA52019.1 MAG: hypothetical protein B7X88_04815 [Polaromonas sp. 17-63-33]OZA87948.1 MAG: hypothetical protein B7X65_10630 [Polaromonas sp. 39-63-25]
MADVSVGQGNQRDQNETEVEKDSALNKTFGEEGTNKTQSKPDRNAKPTDVGAGKWIEPSPFTR